MKPSPEPSENALWLKKQIGEEIANWTQAHKDHTRNRFPDYLIFVTNVELTPVAQTGGIDTVTEYTKGKLADAAEAGFPRQSVHGVARRPDQVDDRRPPRGEVGLPRDARPVPSPGFPHTRPP